MFGMTFGEMLVIGLVAMVVFGPRELPVMLRKVGTFAGKMRRTALDLRVKSGIDDVLRDANISDDLNELRKLSRGELGGLDSELRNFKRGVTRQLEGTVASAGVGTATLTEAAGDTFADASGQQDPYAHLQRAADNDAYAYGRPELDHVKVMERALLRAREYPESGCDAYDAIPDAVQEYDNLPSSRFATHALYTQGAGPRDHVQSLAEVAGPAPESAPGGADHVEPMLQSQMRPA